MEWTILVSVLSIFGLLVAIGNGSVRWGGMGVAIVFIITVATFINGVDWVNYYDKFGEQWHGEIKYEIGFSYVFLLLNAISENFFVALILYYVFCFLVFYFFVIKLPCNYNKPVFIAALIMLSGTDLFTDQIRQLLAVFISLYTINDFVNMGKKRWLLVVFASLFHISALIITVFYIINRRIRRTLLLSVAIFIIVISVFLTLPHIIHLVLSLIDVTFLHKLAFYLDRFDVTPRFGFFALVDIAMILCAVTVKYEKIDAANALLLNMIVACSFLHLSFYFFPIMQRLMVYLYIPHVLFISGMFNNVIVGRVNFQLLIVFLCIIVISCGVFVSSLSNDFRPNFFEWRLTSLSDVLDAEYQRSMRDFRCQHANFISPGFCHY